MFRALGAVLVLWYLSSLFTQSFSAMDNALAASFHMLESAAVVSERQFTQ